MFDTVSFGELEEQRVELLPARTVLSMFSAVGEDLIPSDPIALVTKATGLSSGTAGASGGSESGGS